MPVRSSINLWKGLDPGLAREQASHHPLVISESDRSAQSRDQTHTTTHSKKPLPAVAVMANVKGRPTRKVMMAGAANGVVYGGKNRLGVVLRGGGTFIRTDSKTIRTEVSRDSAPGPGKDRLERTHTGCTGRTGQGRRP